MKPYGLCGSCKYRGKCMVETQTNAKVVACPYRAEFKQNDKVYGKPLRPQKATSKV